MSADADTFLEALNNHTIREEARLDRIATHLGEISRVQAVQHEVLREHIARSEANEAAIEIFRTEVPAKLGEAVNKIDSRLKPLENSIVGWASLGKALTVLGLIVGVVAGLLKLTGH